jgi:hypothetical protein
MQPEMTNFRAIAANLVAEGEVCDLAHPDVSTQTETDKEIAPLIQQIGDTSIAEIDRLIVSRTFPLQDDAILLCRSKTESAKKVAHSGYRRCLVAAALLWLWVR